MASIHDMTVDELAQVITPQFLEESAQQIAPILQQIPFQVFQDQTAKYVTVLPGVRNQITFGELDGDAQLAPYSVQNHDKAEYGIVGRTLVVYPGNCAKDFDPMPLLHSIWGESIALGENISKHNIARKLVSLFAGKIGMHINDVIFCGAVRKVSGTTTADLFDSFDTIIGKEITAENIKAANGNYIKLGAINKTNAIEKLKAFWRAADKMLRGRKVYMYISPDVYADYCDDYQTRHGALPYNQSYDKVFLEGSNNKCEFAVLDNMAGSNYLKITVKQNLLLGTDIMNQQNAPYIGSYSPWACTFAYAGIYGLQIRSLRKENIMIGDITADDDDDDDEEQETIVVKSDVEVAFTNSVVNATMGDENVGQTATTDPAGKTLAYSSSDETVATVNESTGAVTLVGAGTTLITATFAGDDEYNAAHASYALAVAAAAQQGGG